MARLTRSKLLTALLTLSIIIFISGMPLQANAWSYTGINFEWETATDNGTTVSETISGVTAVVSSNAFGVDLWDSAGWHGAAGNIVLEDTAAITSITITFSEAVDVVSIFTVNTGSEAGQWTFTPTGVSTNAVTTTIPQDTGITVFLNWAEVTSFTISSDNDNTGFGFDTLSVDTEDVTMPTLLGAVRNSDTQITVELSEACQNLTKANDGGFTVTKTGTAIVYTVSAISQGVDVNHVVLTVADMTDAQVPGVTVTYTIGGNGTIIDLAGNALATDSIGVAVAAWDTIAPTVLSINRYSPTAEVTNAASVIYRVTFSEAVTGVDSSDFSLTATGSLAGTIVSVSAVSGAAYDVTVNTISGEGTLRLDLNASGTGIADIGGIAIATGYTSGQTYTIDTAPMISGAVRNSNTQITITLTEACQNIDKLNDGGFTVTKSGASTTYAVSTTAQGTDTNHVVLTVEELGTAAGAGVTVTYTTGGNGTIADTAGNTMETNTAGVSIMAWGTTAPTVSGINRQTPTSEVTNASSVTYRVTFSEAVTGVDTSDFTVTASDTASGTVSAISASGGTTIDVTVSSISGNGTLRLDLSSSGTGITDVGGTPLASGYISGQTYIIDKVAPTLSHAIRDSNTQIMVALTEACQNIDKLNDGGFTVTKSGTSTTYAVSDTAQGTNASYVVLTVADIASAGNAGITVTYTTGGNGTITDTAGNAMETDTVGVSVAAWDTSAPVMLSAVRNSNTQITITVSEPCLNCDKPNDGGFTVTKSGTLITYQVYSTAHGSIILTVEDMSSAGGTGVTVTYTAGNKGTITDLYGNSMASTNLIGSSIVITPWVDLHPQTGDNARPALWLGLLLGSGLLAVIGAVNTICRYSRKTRRAKCTKKRTILGLSFFYLFTSP